MRKIIYSIIGVLLFSCTSSKKVSIPSGEVISIEQTGSFFPGEIKPSPQSPCFQGAYYRKAMSSKDHWIGIKGEVILPQLNFDQERINPNKPKQFLDVSSIYLGGNMDGQETDIGLAWEIIKDENGAVSEQRLAFRPFLRRTGHQSGQQSVYINGPAVKDFYWYPGDTVMMSVEVVQDGQLHFVIEGEGKKYETLFACAGYTLNGIGDFKRVNAIDQVGNEGKAAQATKTSLNNAKWNYTTLIRMQEGKKVEVPMHTGRFTSMICPEPRFFEITYTDQERLRGGETLSIIGKP